MSKEIAKVSNSLTTAKTRDIISGMDDDKAKLIKAALSPRIVNMTPQAVTDDLIDEISRAANNSGQKIEDADILVYADEVYSQCLRLYPAITTAEITLAIRNGIYKDYGEYYGLNPKSIIQFVKGYMESEARRIAKNEFEAAKLKAQEPPPQLTDEDIGELIRLDVDLVQKGDKDLVLFAMFKYVYLRRNRMIFMRGNAGWQKGLAIAQDYIYSQKLIKSTKTKRGKDDFKEFTEMVETFETKGIPKDYQSKLILTARKLRYIAFLEYLIKTPQ